MFKSDGLNFLLFLLPFIFIGFFIVKNRWAGATIIFIGYLISLVEYISEKVTGSPIDLFTLLRIDMDMILMAPVVMKPRFCITILLSLMIILVVIKWRINKYESFAFSYKKIKKLDSIVNWLSDKKITCVLKIAVVIFSIIVFATNKNSLAIKNLFLEWQEYQEYSTVSEEELFNRIGMKDNYIKNNFITAFPGKNVVIIYCESLENGYFNQNNFPNVLPHLNSKKDSSFAYYTDYRNVSGTGWTIGALYATQTGFPCFFGHNGNDVFNKVKSTDVVSYASVLQKAGYDNLFMSSANLEFAGTGNLMKMFGYQTKDIKEFKGDVSKTGWGVHDYDLFEQAKIEYKRMLDKEKPFNLTLLTVDTHFTNGLPDERLQQFVKIPYDKKVSMEYCLASLDYLIDDFEKFIKSQPNAQNTVLIIMGDHPVMGSASQTPVVGRLEKEPRRITLMSNGYSTQYSIDDKIGYHDIPDFILETVGVKHNAKFPNKVFDGDFESLVKNNASLFTHINLKLNQ